MAGGGCSGGGGWLGGGLAGGGLCGGTDGVGGDSGGVEGEGTKDVTVLLYDTPSISYPRIASTRVELKSVTNVCVEARADAVLAAIVTNTTMLPPLMLNEMSLGKTPCIVEERRSLNSVGLKVFNVPARVSTNSTTPPGSPAAGCCAVDAPVNVNASSERTKINIKSRRPT